MNGYTLDDWYRALDQLGKRPKWRKNSREIRAYCPAHPATSEDGLSVEEKQGGIVWYCHSGCDGDAVREAVGFEKRRESQRPHSQRHPPESEEPPKPGPLPSGAPWRKPWIYTDAEGAPVLAVVRKDLGLNEKTGKMRKTFAQFTPAADKPGLWIAKGIEYGRPLYQLQQILTAPPDATIRVVEGEKCADAHKATWPEQFVTTWPGGGPAWTRTDWKPLARRNVEMVADGNESGHSAMVDLAKHLVELDCKVKVLLPDKDGTDVADWLEQDDPQTVEAKIQAGLTPYGVEMHPGFERFEELAADWDNLPDDEGPPPTIIERSDGKPLLYANKLNGVFGLPGGGKSWIGIIALFEVLGLGGRVLWLDFEDRPPTFRDRSRSLGQEPANHGESLKWLPPTIMEDAESQAFAAAVAWVSAYEDGLVVIDAATQAGCPADGTGVEPWYVKHVDPWREVNAGVLLIDHVPKRNEDRPEGPIGSTAKLGRVDGAALFVQGRCWTREKDGSLQLIVHKDRQGHVGAKGDTVAIAVGKHNDKGILDIRFVPPSEAVDAQPVADALLAALVENGGEVVSMRVYRELVGGKAAVADAAMKLLVDAGHVESSKRGSSNVYLVTAEGYEMCDITPPHEQGGLM